MNAEKLKKILNILGKRTMYLFLNNGNTFKCGYSEHIRNKYIEVIMTEKSK